MRFRAQVGLAMYQCRLNDPGDVVHCCRKDTAETRKDGGVLVQKLTGRVETSRLGVKNYAPELAADVGACLELL